MAIRPLDGQRPGVATWSGASRIGLEAVAIARWPGPGRKVSKPAIASTDDESRANGDETQHLLVDAGGFWPWNARRIADPPGTAPVPQQEPVAQARKC